MDTIDKTVIAFTTAVVVAATITSVPLIVAIKRIDKRQAERKIVTDFLEQKMAELLAEHPHLKPSN